MKLLHELPAVYGDFRASGVIAVYAAWWNRLQNMNVNKKSIIHNNNLAFIYV